MNQYTVSPDILSHPFLQLFSYFLPFPFTDVCYKNTWIKGAVAGVDAQLSDFLFAVVQKSHIGCLWDEMKINI